MSDFMRVEFKTVDGVILRGNFFKAEEERSGVVVMASGLTLLKEHFVDEFARHFRTGGISALVFDHRSYGSSDGDPCHQTDPDQQAEDYHDAVTAAMDLPGVSPSRVGVWGVGHSGMAAMIAAASDPRLKAVVLHGPNYSGAIDAAQFPKGTLERAWAERERLARDNTASPTYERVWADSPENARGEGEPTFLRGEPAFNLYTAALERSNAAGTPWKNGMTLQSFYHVARTEAHEHLPRISPPTLYIVVAGDPFSGSWETHRDVAAKLGPKGEFDVIRPTGTAEIRGWAGEAMARHLAFFKRFL